MSAKSHESIAEDAESSPGQANAAVIPVIPEDVGATSSPVEKLAMKSNRPPVNDPIPVVIHKLLDVIDANKKKINVRPTMAGTKRNQFRDAVALLTAEGTTLGQPTYISLPVHGACVIADKTFTLTGNACDFPSSTDEFGNPYFGINGDPQAHRIGAREVLKMIEFPGGDRCPEVVFYVADQMARMHIKGVPMDCTHMQELRKLAINQASMEVMLSNSKYDGIGCYARWKLGNMIPIHFKKKATHIDLYTSPSINPLNLPQTIWWALMMCMFGIFTEQLKSYKGAVTALCAENGCAMSETNFLKIICAKYSESLTGNPVLITLESTQRSFFTRNEFPAGAQLFRLKDHGQCRSRALYSGAAGSAAAASAASGAAVVGASEVDYVNQHGCLFCKHKPHASEWEAVAVEDKAAKLADAMRQAAPLTVRLGAALPVALLVAEPAVASEAAALLVHTVFSATASELQTHVEAMARMSIASNNRLLFSLMGVTGSGKTTAREKLERLLITKGYKVLVASADDFSKLGHKDAGPKVIRNIRAFTATREKHAIIVDICNERGVIPRKIFGCDLSKYKGVTFVPNFDKSQDDFKDYECFCLNNVLARPMHSAYTNFWLDPFSAGVKVCIEVHNKKAVGIKRILGVAGDRTAFESTLSMQAIQDLIRDGAARHIAKLAARPSLDEQLTVLLTSMSL